MKISLLNRAAAACPGQAAFVAIPAGRFVAKRDARTGRVRAKGSKDGLLWME